MALRLENADRDRIKQKCNIFGVYVRVNHGGTFSGHTGRPDLQGVGFGCEVKREDKQDLWGACTPLQKKELMEFAAAGGRACVVRLEKLGSGRNTEWNAIFRKVGPEGPTEVRVMTLEELVNKLSGRAAW